MNFGHHGALEFLNHQRGHELGSTGHECEHAEAREHAHDHGEMDGLDEIGYQLSELNEKTDTAAKSLDEIASSLTEVADIGHSIIRLTDAVARVGDILDKRLS